MRRHLLLVALALLAGCTAAEQAPDEDAAAKAVASEPAPAPLVGLWTSSIPPEFTTAILPDGFQHARLDATVPTTIRWWNVDNRTHSVYSDDGGFASAAAIPPLGDYFWTFLTPGEYGFHCRIHEGMRGVVVVTAS